MKRFLMFLVIAIAVVSLGLTIYYFSVDNEMIYIKSSYLVVNAGKSFSAEGENGLLDFRNRADSTTLTYSVQADEDNKDVLKYFENEKIFRAEKGGEAQIVINTNNRSYSRLVVDVLVCDGSADYPFMVNNEEELIAMDGSLSYKLNGDVEVTKPWVPKNFSGVFDGNFHTISGIVITDSEISSGSDVGFISNLSGTIKNLYLKDIDINVSKANTIGAFAGKVNGGTIQTSEATGTIQNTNNTMISKVGGVAGSINNTSKIDRCGFDGEFIITGSGITAGGIAGESNNSVVSESYSRLKLDNGTYPSTVFGGIIGETTGDKANAYDCYFYAKEEPTNNGQGRIAGIIYQKNNEKSLVTGCYYGGNMNEASAGLNKGQKLGSDANGYLDDTVSGFQNQGKFITTISANPSDANRPWNFNGTWTLGSEKYPILNVTTSVASSYVDIDSGNISTDGTLNTAQKLYDAMKDNSADCSVLGNDANGNLNMNGYVWKVITNYNNGTEFSQKLGSKSTGAKIKIYNFTIDATDVTTSNGYVGLVSKMNGATISNITFEDVKIITNGSQNFHKVGVLAGQSTGVTVNNVSIKGVDVFVTGVSSNTDASFFGTFFGTADNATTLNRVEANDVDVTNGFYTVAGGFIGAGYATITATGSQGSNKLYNYANDIKLVANYAGGIVGANGGKISYTTSSNVLYNNENTSSASNYSKQIYSNGINKAFVGGIVGTNEYKITSGGVTSRTKGTISDVYANSFSLKTTSTANHKLYYGGIAGYNSSNITRAYVKGANMVVSGQHNAFVGGITGYNSGTINNSVVDADSRISTTIAIPGTSINSSNYMLNTDNCTIVGGIAGYDTNSTNNTCSIWKSATFMKEIRGCYAGGISGISFGKVQYSYCGETKKDNGGVTITGFFAGGLTSVAAGGFIKNCYTICRLNPVSGNFSYKNVMSVVRMETSAAGGLAVFALNSGTTIESCYCVASFGSGVTYGSSADLTGFVCGTVTNCAYLNAGWVATRNGKQLTRDNLKGVPNYNAFLNALQSSSSVWDFPSNSGYPTIAGVNVNFPSSTVPVFH